MEKEQEGWGFLGSQKPLRVRECPGLQRAHFFDISDSLLPGARQFW